jgi:hypothetical protein
MQAAALRSAPQPADTWSPPVRALWYEAHGDWQRAHDELQDDADRQAAWVHAYLHRVEGDVANAAYWYRRAGRPVPAPAVTLADEWHEIAEALLQ